LKENIVSGSSSSSTHHRPPQRQQPASFQNQPSIPIGANNIDSTGFSQAEIHDLEESFKLFDIYGEGSVQVGDLRSILEVLQQEQQQQQQQQSTAASYPHLETLLDRLSELSDEDNLTMDDYVQLMASTTITNAITIDNHGDGNGDDSNNNHFARVFQLFDTDGNGYITVNDLERIAIELGEHDMTTGELQEMIDRARGSNGNNNNDGDDNKVGIDEFTRMMSMSLFPPNDDGEV